MFICLCTFSFYHHVCTDFLAEGRGDRQEPASNFLCFHCPIEPDSTTLVGGTISDDNGQFTLADVKPGNYVISVSFMGYKSHKELIKVASSQTLSFTLERHTIQRADSKHV